MQNKFFIVQYWLKQFSQRLSFLCVLLSLLMPVTALGVPTSPDQALRVVKYWLYMDQQPLSARMGTEVRDLVTFDDEQGEPLYHVVNLNPDGFVIVSGDNGVEPIIAFVPMGEFDPSFETPLGAMISRDIPQRVEFARAFDEASYKSLEPEPDNTLLAAQQKWISLDRSIPDWAMALREPTISDKWVTPFVLTQWDQEEEDLPVRELCYNYYTPNHYPAGCVATAMAQVMKFFVHPTTGVGTPIFSILVDGSTQDVALRGGNDSGGVYQWNLMDNGPDIPELTHRQAIGRLTHDAGVSVGMKYTPGLASTAVFKAADSLLSTFKYSNAKKGFDSWYTSLDSDSRNTMTNPNLDAGFPVVYAVKRPLGGGSYAGHVILCDGYGYDNQTMYHHLNMGWSGNDNVWYNLPTVDANDQRTYPILDACIYNIYPTGSGEIISGRVTDANGVPLENVIVTAVRDGGGTYHSEPTGENGIYALPKIPSASEYAMSADLAGYSFNTYDHFHNNKVSTGTSVDRTTTVGNVWGVNFSGEPPIRPTLTTQAVTNVSNTTATGNGTITEQGNVEWIQHGMCWGRNPNLDMNTADECSYEGSAKPAGAFTSGMTPLLSGTTYYVRAYIFHMLGRAYGNEVVFTTSSDSPPEVTTSSVTTIDFNGATSGGNISSIGSASVTEHGVCLGLNVNPTTSDSCTQQGASGTGVFISSLTGLLAGTKYHVRAYAVNSVGTAYGADVRFITDSYVLPTVMSFPVTDIGNRSATGHGSLAALGNPALVTQYGICWDTGNAPDITDRCDTINTPQNKIIFFTGDITGLIPLETYYVRAYAINEAGIAYSVARSFTTSDTTDLIVTGEVSSISAVSATGSVYINLDGPATLDQHGVCWSKNSTPTVGGTSVSCSQEGTAKDTLSITTPITGLSSGSMYYVRGYASKAGNTAYGNEVSFTAASHGSVTTDVVLPAVDRALAKGSIVSLGSPNPTRHGFCWSVSADPDTGDDCLNRGSVSATGPFVAILTGLSPATTYHVRAYVTNNAGTRYGDDISFITSKASAVSTQAVSGISTTTATGNGTIVDVGVPSATAHGICWSTVSSPAVGGNCTDAGAASETGAFTGAMTGLSPGTLYSVRAYVTNSIGTSYGGELSFKAFKEPTVSTQAVSSIFSTTAIGNGTVTDLGVPSATAHGVCWSESANPVVGGTCTNVGTVSESGPFSGALTGLSPVTMYHVRAYVTNSAGIVYGADVSFTTAEAPSAPPFFWNLFLPAILSGSQQ